MPPPEWRTETLACTPCEPSYANCTTKTLRAKKIRRSAGQNTWRAPWRMLALCKFNWTSVSGHTRRHEQHWRELRMVGTRQTIREMLAEVSNLPETRGNRSHEQLLEIPCPHSDEKNTWINLWNPEIWDCVGIIVSMTRTNCHTLSKERIDNCCGSTARTCDACRETPRRGWVQQVEQT